MIAFVRSFINHPITTRKVVMTSIPIPMMTKNVPIPDRITSTVMFGVLFLRRKNRLLQTADDKRRNPARNE